MSDEKGSTAPHSHHPFASKGVLGILTEFPHPVAQSVEMHPKSRATCTIETRRAATSRTASVYFRGYRLRAPILTFGLH